VMNIFLSVMIKGIGTFEMIVIWIILAIYEIIWNIGKYQNVSKVVFLLSYQILNQLYTCISCKNTKRNKQWLLYVDNNWLFEKIFNGISKWKLLKTHKTGTFNICGLKCIFKYKGSLMSSRVHWEKIRIRWYWFYFNCFMLQKNLKSG
jgi:hypothetical protein